MSNATIRPVAVGPRTVGRRTLTPIQQRIWTSQRLAPRAPLANMGTAHRLTGPIDPATFVEAMDEVVRSSDVLRTVLDDGAGRVWDARILFEPPRRTSVIDLPVDQVDGWCRDRIAVPIDATTCAYDSVLVRHGETDWTWWLDLHHLVTDAWSSMLVFEAVSASYRRLVDGASGEPERRPSFYEHETVTVIGEGSDRGDESGWDLDAAGDDVLLPYGARGSRTTEVTHHDVTTAARVAESHARYRTFSPELGTLALLCTTTAVTLHRLDGHRAVSLGVPVHHRTGPAARAVIGPLLEIYPLLVDVESSETFGETFDRVHRSLLEMLRRARSLPAPDVAFDAVVNVQTATYEEFAGMASTSIWYRSQHVEAAHPVRVHAFDYGDGARIELDLNIGLSTDGAHLAFADHLARTIDAALSDPETVVGDYDPLTDSEIHLLETLDPAPLDDPFDRPVHRVIAERLRADPSHVVAEHDGIELTAVDLDERAERLCRWLIEREMGPGHRVGVRMRRSLDVLVAVHGILRSGAAFVMLDPDDPDERHRAIIDDAGLDVVLDELPPLDAEVQLDVDRAECGLDDIAYVIYTSGSTGTPKGVPIPHRGLADYLRNAVEAYPTTSEFVMPMHSALTFDLSITSLFLPQLVGGRTVVVAGDPVTALSTIARDGRLTVLKATPSQLELLARMVSEPLGLEVVIVGGEAFRRPTATAVAEFAPGVRIFNEYGPAEAVVGCMLHEWDPETDVGVDVPIGRATPGARIHILDERGQRTPVGAWGELYVWRTGMAAGYLDLPEATQEKFAVIERVDAHVLYRTGDRVRIERGVVVYGGRIDDQLSVSGVRLEPGEIEAALMRHPDVTNAVVRVWSPQPGRVRHCARCGLGTDVPGVQLDDDDVCSVCIDFDRIEPQTRTWFRSTEDLDVARDAARSRATGAVDCLHLLSGGKDSTYALYQLVERGWRVHALTLDNGFISDGAKENIRRSVEDLGVTHEFVTTDAMNEIFRDSLDRFANVCNGCYKTIYTLATARAHELGIPVVVTGLSRGQFFETRLVPHQFEADRFDPDEIDRTVLQARRAYHQTRDAVTELLPEQALFDRTDIDVLAEIEYLDFYRYVDVELSEMYEFLEQRAPWVRPDDTGRSTNCLVNVVGIHTHRTERGYHNYAEPYSWDVRLGHKTRVEALDELDDAIDPTEIQPMLDEIGYEPRRPEILTAWFQTSDGLPRDARMLAAHLREILPARSVPSAFVHVDELPLADSTKLDVSALPPPASTHLRSAAFVAPNTTTEAITAHIWATILDVDRVGLDDDFFDLGGASLAALETVAATERRFDIELPDALVFQHRCLQDFAAAVDTQLDSGASLVPVPPLDPGRPLPLSAGEEAMLFEYRSAPTDVRYNVTRHYTVPADLDEERFRRAIRRVVERHQPLHTAYDDARTQLAVDDAVSVEALPPGSLDEVIDHRRRTPFDLDHGPLVRVHVGRAEAGAWDVVIGLHHITVDAGSFDILWNDLDAAYHDRPLPALTTSYAAHGAWQREAVAEGGFPIARIEDFIGTELPPLDAGRVGSDGYLDRAASVSTSELAGAAATTPFAAALAAASVVLSAYSRDDTVELGITASTKDHPSSEPLVGYYLNSIPIVIRLDATDTLAAADDLAGALVAQVLPHRTHPFADIVRQARSEHRPTPDISHMLAYERLAPARFGGTTAEHRIIAAPSAVNDITFFVQERGDDLRLGIEYRGSVVSSATADRLLASFDDVLTAICHHPGRSVADARRSLVGADLTGPPLTPEPATPLHRLLRHAVSTPDAVAVIESTGGSTTYGQLVGRAALLASELRSQLGAPARIGVSLPRSSALLEAIVAVWLAGAAYVPIDPAIAPGRRRKIVEAADLDVVLVDPTTAPLFTGVRCIDPATVTGADSDVANAGVGAAPLPVGGDLAYVIFTSGSTGEPAGVPVSHANLAASNAARDQFYGEAPARFLVTSSIGFDSSLVGILWPLATGGAVVMPHDDDVHDVDRLGDLIDELDVSHLLMVPSLYQALLRRRADRLTGLHTAVVAGEWCPPALVGEHHRRVPDVELVNEYGPTEATVWATAHRCHPSDDPVPIGTPISGCRIRVADRHQRPVGLGGSGELLIDGPGVVSGYLSGRSNDAFVDHGEHRWYRTGDLVRVDDGGRIVFVGRVDDQLNVGGLRIEPVEVEAHLLDLDGVSDAVVTSAVVDGRPSMVAHVVADSVVADLTTIRAHVTEKVGAAAAPRQVGYHESLPRTSNGKLDRTRAAQLPLAVGPADDTRRATSSIRPDGLVDVWCRALGRDDLGVDSDFFALGSDSIAAVEIVSALGDLVGREVAIAELLVAPTPARMATLLGLGEDDASETPPVTAVTLRPGAPGGPTVVMTPAWDSVMGYRDLADAFPDDVRVLAVAVTDSTSASGSALLTVDQLGATAIDVAIDALGDDHDGPLAVLGWSIGGVAAYDLGPRLQARGVDVTAVALVDTVFPGEHRHLWSNRWWKYKSMLRPGMVGEAAREFALMARRRVDKLAVRLGRRLMSWGGQPVERAAVETTASGVPHTALDDAPSPTTVPIVLYAARTTNPDRSANRWRTVASEFLVVPIDGRHRGFQSVMGADRVHVIAADLVQRLTVASGVRHRT